LWGHISIKALRQPYNINPYSAPVGGIIVDRMIPTTKEACYLLKIAWSQFVASCPYLTYIQ